jgi:hypothetical protein
MASGLLRVVVLQLIFVPSKSTKDSEQLFYTYQTGGTSVLNVTNKLWSLKRLLYCSPRDSLIPHGAHPWVATEATINAMMLT